MANYWARAAQERLVALEKEKAPFILLIEQAAIFSNCPLSNSTRDFLHKTDGLKHGTANPVLGTVHGRQEWALRWLLKQLQSEQDARLAPESWGLLSNLIRILPISNLSRILKEKKFIALLRQTVEEANKEWENLSHVATSGSQSFSKKRRHSGELAVEEKSQRPQIREDLREQLFAAMDEIIERVKPQGPNGSQEDSAALAAEYMRSVIRTTGEDAAKILGSWFEVIKHVGHSLVSTNRPATLKPFHEIWTSRVLSNDDVMNFSRHCLTPAMELLSDDNLSIEDKSTLEVILAQNVIMPAKNAYSSTKTITLFRELVGETTRRIPRAKPLIFDISARCLRRQPSGRYRVQDSAWLQELFLFLKDDITPNQGPECASEQNTIYKLLQCCMSHTVSLDLRILKSVVVDYGFSMDDQLNLAILSTVVKLDANTFLLADDTNILDELFKRITMASVKPTWPDIAEKVVDQILIPLLGGLAWTRSLVEFIYQWHNQLLEFERLRRNTMDIQKAHHMKHFGAWEDDALQIKLREIMENTLTSQQIVEVIEWLESQPEENVQATLVLSDAVTRAIIRNETSDMVGPRVYKSWITKIRNWDTVDDRYQFRRLRILSRILKWPFMSELHSVTEIDFPDICPETQSTIHSLEAYRYRCAMLTCEDIPASEKQISPGIWKIIDTSRLKHILDIDTNDVWGKRVPITADLGYYACAVAHTVLVEYPTVLEKYVQTFTCKDKRLLRVYLMSNRYPALLKSNERSRSDIPLRFTPDESLFVRNMIWMASASTPYSQEHSSSPWLRKNSHAFPGFWAVFARNVTVLDKNIIGNIVSLMLECGSHVDNPFEQSRACNGFVIQFLNKLPLDVFSRQNRQKILSSWMPELPDPSFHDNGALAYKMTPLDPEILGLKLKIMDRAPILYDGAAFEDLIQLADAVATYVSKPMQVLQIVKEYAQATIRHLVSTVDQPKSVLYLKQALEYCQVTCDKRKSVVKKDVTRVVPASGVILIGVILSLSQAATERIAAVDPQLLASWDIQRSNIRTLLVNNLAVLLGHDDLKDGSTVARTSLLTTLDALDYVRISDEEQEVLRKLLKKKTKLLKQYDQTLARRVEIFFMQQFSESMEAMSLSVLSGATPQKENRLALIKGIKVATSSMTDFQKLQMASSILKDLATSDSLDKSLALRLIFKSCDDLRHPSSTGEQDGATFSLSMLYTAVTSRLKETREARQFCLLVEILEDVLREKAHALTQYNIDSTLSTITAICSSSGPSFSPSFATTIFSHLCALLSAVLAAHRLKLQGHFHLLTQTLQSLLRCLFLPVSSSATRAEGGRPSSPPPWLLATSSDPNQQLQAHHAELFARLITQICDPSVSAVSKKRHHQSNAKSAVPLTSATAKAKHIAAQRMPLVLASYIDLRLDMRLKISPEIREKLTPAIYAIFDTMNVEGRKVLGESLDAAGRAVLVELVRDWSRFGRWRGL